MGLDKDAIKREVREVRERGVEDVDSGLGR
jgi:hypothetical protein